MCGILGMNVANKDLAREAIELFAYRGPDGSDIFVDGQVTLGFQRLAIIDLDPRSNQPMSDREKTATVVFNGEIYNYQTLKEELSKDYQFETTSDTEVLLYAYKKWGVDLVKYIKGMYAFGIYDHQQGKFFLFRDYSGIKPLYYYDDGSLFIFASEVKGILHILKRLNKVIEVDKNQLNLFYCLGYIPSPLTLYKNVFKLPLRSSLEYDLVSHTKQINSFQTLIQPAAGLGEFQTLLEKKIIDHLIADVPVGVLFSGGTDSSVIASVLKKNNIRLENFSIQMSHKKEDEKFFKAISQYLDIKSHVYEFGQHEFEEVYPQVMSRLDEPFADGSIFPTFYISQKAAEKVKVVLGGDGGDEYFYGYPRDRVLYPYNERPDYEMTWLDKLYFIIPQLPFKNAVFKRLFRLARQPLSYYLANASLGKDLVPWQRCKEEMRRRQLKPLDLDKLWNLENISLRKTDLATSYNSIEGRVPLLDIDVIVNSDQFEKIKLSGGCLKYLLKKILLSYLPHKFVFRGKSGFGANLKEKFHHSPQLQQDLARAIEFLKSRDLLPPGFKIKKQGWYAKRYPNFCFSLIVLYYNLQYAE